MYWLKDGLSYTFASSIRFPCINDVDSASQPIGDFRPLGGTSWMV